MCSLTRSKRTCFDSNSFSIPSSPRSRQKRGSKKAPRKSSSAQPVDLEAIPEKQLPLMAQQMGAPGKEGGR